MKLAVRRIGDTAIVDVDGGDDGGAALVDAVAGLLDRGEKRIVLHLRVHSFDSSALGAATACWLKARNRGAALKIASRQPKVWELIRVLKLDRVLDCHRSVEEAVESFQ
jgi:anti-anti-sigma factor